MIVLSIIIPTYNNTDTIGRCIASLGVTLPKEEIEIVVVDDGSSDGNPLQAVPQGGTGLPLRLLRQEHTGAAAARNRGLLAATGEWVWFVDADDWIAPNALAHLLPALQRCSAEAQLFKMGQLYFPHDDATRSEADDALTRPVDIATLFVPKSGCLDHTTYLFRRNFLLAHTLRYPEGHTRLEDSLFILDVLTAMHRHAESPHALMGNTSFRFYHYCERSRHAVQRSWYDEQSPQMLADILLFFDHLRQLLPELAADEAAAQAFYTRYAYVYMRVLAVKGCRWSLITPLRNELLPHYHPTTIPARALRHASLHRLLQLLCSWRRMTAH